MIAGGGPAGSSTAIRLASAGFRVTLIERERFPREKLCGEFISPESLRHFASLGVLGQMLDAGGARISATHFFDIRGRGIVIPSQVLDAGECALGLSRARMDEVLLRRAGEAGAEVIEEAAAAGVEMVDGRVAAVRVRTASGDKRIEGGLFIDATGRSGILAKLAAKENGSGGNRRRGTKIVGFKTHFRGAALGRDACEIYSFPGGYGGASPVEGGRVNVCLFLTADAVKLAGGSGDRILEDAVMVNPRARSSLFGAARDGEWLTVAVDDFGVWGMPAATNLLTVGDAAGFADPFTGSGILLALESSELLAGCITGHWDDADALAEHYRTEYKQRFASRFGVLRLLRRAAFSPFWGKMAIAALRRSEGLRTMLARATRGQGNKQK